MRRTNQFLLLRLATRVLGTRKQHSTLMVTLFFLWLQVALLVFADVSLYAEHIRTRSIAYCPVIFQSPASKYSTVQKGIPDWFLPFCKFSEVRLRVMALMHDTFMLLMHARLWKFFCIQVPESLPFPDKH